MNTRNYPDSMRTDTDPLASRQETGRSWFWPVFFALQAIQFFVSRLTGWPWWVLSAPVVVIAGLGAAYYWAKNRRREAEAAAGVSSG